jgi:8-oxo-dGTP pyrophosphatase MutT (NUDIX family)
MVREFSAGGVFVKKGAVGLELAVIEPRKDPPMVAAKGKKSSQKVTLALPKGLVDPGEKPEETALREVFEETGVKAHLISKLLDIKYVYVRTWGDQERVFKIVSFYLFRYESGEINNIAPAMRIEVNRALWISLEESSRKLAYRGERDAVKKAVEYLEAHPEV